MVYTISLGKQGKWVHTTGPERVYTIGPETLKKKRVFTLVVYTIPPKISAMNYKLFKGHFTACFKGSFSSEKFK